MRSRDLTTVAVLFSLATTVWAQQVEPRFERHPAEQLPLEPIERFSGPLPARRNAVVSGARVVLRHWNIANDQRVEIPHQGFLVVQLHSGEVLVTIGEQRSVRHGDEFWTVAPGERLIVETARDSVVLRTLDTIVR